MKRSARFLLSGVMLVCWFFLNRIGGFGSPVTDALLLIVGLGELAFGGYLRFKRD